MTRANSELFRQLSGESAGLHFTVRGEPVPQGSMKAIKGRHQRHAAVIAHNQAKLDPWREAVSVAAWGAWGKRERITGPVVLVVRFFFHRPGVDFVNGDGVRVKERAPRSMYRVPDLDKLLRAICDGLTGRVLKDDRQICEIHARKDYTASDTFPRAEVHLYPDDP